MSGQRPLLRIALTCGAILLGTVIIGAQLSTSQFTSQDEAQDQAPRIIHPVEDDSEEPEATEDTADASAENESEDSVTDGAGVDRQAVIDALSEAGYTVVEPDEAAANPDEKSEDRSDEEEDDVRETSTDP